ncbi:MAG: putative glycosyltransferase [Cyanobacteria bacterium RYN_339]|nr:putative glycosyltransferase [Cyanobacteria bacterium RYN_339]
MRIAVIGKKFPFCGIVTYCRELVRTMRARGHEVAFFYLHEEEVHFEREEGLPYLFKTHMYTIPMPDTRARLADSLRAFAPDVVHASFALSPLDFALPEVCRELGVPLVATFHVALDHRPSLPNHVSGFVYRMYASTLAKCGRVIIFSELQRAKLARLGVPAGRIDVVPNGVDVQRWSPGPSRFKAAIGATHVVGYMGRLDPEKNVGALLEAFTQASLPPNTHLAIVGDGVLGARLRRKHADVPNVHWLGFIQDEDERRDILRGCDVFALPSSVEGLSIALLEGMACGAAPLATDVGADGEVIQGVGRVIDPTRLPEELAPALTALLADPDELARLREASRRRVVTRYSAQQNASALLEVYAAAGRAVAAS